jgi:hypothetical protein
VQDLRPNPFRPSRKPVPSEATPGHGFDLALRTTS